MRKFFYVLGYTTANLIGYSLLTGLFCSAVYLFYLFIDFAKSNIIAKGFIFSLFGLVTLLYLISTIKNAIKKQKEKDRIESLMKGLDDGKIIVMNKSKK